MLQRHQQSKLSRIDPTIATRIYHGIFDYFLDDKEVLRWSTGSAVGISKDAHIPHFIKTRLIKQSERKRVSKTKLKKAQSAANFIARLPSILMVGVTGSLAMKNSNKGSDIDLMVVTDVNTLWITRLCTLLGLALFGWKIRRAGQQEEPDALCLNIWMDVEDLAVSEKNIFTAHELCQIIPLVNKKETYQKLLRGNFWTKKYWPYATDKIYVPNTQSRGSDSFICKGLQFLEPFARKLQWWYMKGKRTREVVRITRAFFHPVDWGDEVTKKLSKRGVRVA